ncbi:hypothetical protein K435DRAFT_834233 [Dendrothele bispora CBS 962.96]|uniref:Rsm22-domain-containing protein n=1 Tax=Dendrothele bispora (strain CBS 962.96) TaxID=1314807 RepID=A0A4S8MVV6_DENBC|nr:hypothetical protein K435DRAFT_834233 [Dendrothele bispora CBS 962.96]
MFRAARTRHLRLSILKLHPARDFSQTTSIASQPNPPLNLDSGLQALLKDVDLSLNRHITSPTPLRELNVVPFDRSNEMSLTQAEISDGDENELERKSPAALFGSQRIGAVILPVELQNAINVLIADSDKPLLHIDAKRLFQEGNEDSDGSWSAVYDVKYRSRHQNLRHRERDGTAFASVALPAHYSAIRSVLEHAKHRLGPDWNISRVIDWGAGTGSSLWASLHTFRPRSQDEVDIEGYKIADSSLVSYLGIEKREGLVSIGKRLLEYTGADQFTVSWQKSYKEVDKIPREEGHDTLAVSAFYLSSLPTALARKQLVKEMWESGAHTLILIDHNTVNGFENIAEARETFLNFGRKESQDPAGAGRSISGCHVVAPCPHDGACPLYHPGSSRLVCGFTQRLQRPSFVRRTKHSGTGHEDIGYSYVVIRRGPRPVGVDTRLGRIGAVGLREIRKNEEAQAPIKELSLHNEDEAFIAEEPSSHTVELEVAPDALGTRSEASLEAGLRQEAYTWPRLVFSPLKKSGHIILDACTTEGKVMRMTIPKSQGKQPFYDARKSSWGDLFPHEPKNAPQERHQPRGTTKGLRGEDIGKRKNSSRRDNSKLSYQALSDSLNTKQSRKKSIRDRVVSESKSRWLDSDD